MKNGFMFIVTITLSLVLALCSSQLYEKNTWYSAGKLKKCSVEELPQLTGTDYLRYNDNDIYCNMDGGDFTDYVETVYEYLEDQDFEYFGTRGEEKSSVAGIFSTWYFEPVESMEECKTQASSEYYIFVYSDGTKDEDEDIIFNVISFGIEDGSVRYDGKKFVYNSTMELWRETGKWLSEQYVLEEEKEVEDSSQTSQV